MQHDEKLEQLAQEIMLRALDIAPKDEAIKGAIEAKQSLVERVQALKAERNTISAQMERMAKEQRLANRFKVPEK